MRPSFYQLLNLDSSATPKDIERAYKRQALLYHPDRNRDVDQKTATEDFQLILEAYQTLSDPIKRLKYDTKLKRPTQTRSHYPPPPPPPPPNKPKPARSASTPSYAPPPPPPPQPTPFFDLPTTTPPKRTSFFNSAYTKTPTTESRPAKQAHTFYAKPRLRSFSVNPPAPPLTNVAPKSKPTIPDRSSKVDSGTKPRPSSEYFETFFKPEPQPRTSSSCFEPFLKSEPQQRTSSSYFDPFSNSEPQQRTSSSYFDPFSNSEPKTRTSSSYFDPFLNSEPKPRTSSSYFDPFLKSEPKPKSGLDHLDEFLETNLNNFSFPEPKFNSNHNRQGPPPSFSSYQNPIPELGTRISSTSQCKPKLGPRSTTLPIPNLFSFSNYPETTGPSKSIPQPRRTTTNPTSKTSSFQDHQDQSPNKSGPRASTNRITDDPLIFSSTKPHLQSNHLPPPISFNYQKLGKVNYESSEDEDEELYGVQWPPVSSGKLDCSSSLGGGHTRRTEEWVRAYSNRK
ncbi:hypothetical protein CROQUDRAFT_652269 [Cronartium quercuum f. sp. fusiforme G11]|uniref:J domain-containing protein n=1 Tax=Cronartium quercuum f. sp. fusiforme G11 TaxID=708437 RepID=A0A9P6NWA0_9BASI|nr:hypothetical protein CROQUDRAFT_652269 [Cronartium quercuum f. sp. fusiforme G11]